MRRAFHIWPLVFLAAVSGLALASPFAVHMGKHTDLGEILSQMNSHSKSLKNVSASLEYTKVTVLVNDKSTETGMFYYRKKGKATEICVNIQNPEQKIMLFKNNLGEIYLPKIKEVQQYDLSQKRDVLQQFLLLGFGTDTSKLQASYNIKYVQEEDVMPGDTNVELELTPHNQSAATQISKIQLWISEESWLPSQQKFVESGGDYLIARYIDVKVNRDPPNSAFELNAPSNVKIVKMN